MKNLSLIVFLIFLAIFFTACSSTENLPRWYYDNTENPKYIYVVATGTSKDKDLAINKANMTAKFLVLKQMEIQIDAIENKMYEELGIKEEFDRLKEISPPTYKGYLVQQKEYRIIEKQIDIKNNYYEAYVLAEYPIGAAKQSFLREILKREELYKRIKDTKAFIQLEKDVKSYKEMKSIN